jgi:hypothetical protein
MGSTDHEQFLFRAQRLGGHVHVHVWAGTPLQADNRARPKLGTLIMDPEQWAALRDLIANGQPYALGEFEVVDYDCPEAAPVDCPDSSLLAWGAHLLADLEPQDPGL